MVITDRNQNWVVGGVGPKVVWSLPERVVRTMVAYITWIVPVKQMLQRQTSRPGPGPRVSLARRAEGGIEDGRPQSEVDVIDGSVDGGVVRDGRLPLDCDRVRTADRGDYNPASSGQGREGRE